MITLGVIADTHVPDRRRSLDRRALDIFQAAGVSEILHAGDVSTPRVLSELEQLAPVHAVRGNRDWLALSNLPFQRSLVYAGVKVGLTHGHGRWWDYLIDRVEYLTRGYRLEMFQPRLLETFPDARVIVFGHTHRPLNRWVQGVLLFNPGSPHNPDIKLITPSVGLLRIQDGGEIAGEIIDLV
jgi:putative phosphoesterase